MAGLPGPRGLGPLGPLEAVPMPPTLPPLLGALAPRNPPALDRPSIPPVRSFFRGSGRAFQIASPRAVPTAAPKLVIAETAAPTAALIKPAIFLPSERKGLVSPLTILLAQPGTFDSRVSTDVVMPRTAGDTLSNQLKIRAA